MGIRPFGGARNARRLQRKSPRGAGFLGVVAFLTGEQRRPDVTINQNVLLSKPIMFHKEGHSPSELVPLLLRLCETLIQRRVVHQQRSYSIVARIQCSLKASNPVRRIAFDSFQTFVPSACAMLPRPLCAAHGLALRRPSATLSVRWLSGHLRARRCRGITRAPCASASTISAHCCIISRRSGKYSARLYAPRMSLRSQCAN